MVVHPVAKLRSLAEPVYLRWVLAVIYVTSFGATPNDGIDHSYEVQRAINASSPGDVISFPAGTYNLSRELALKGEGRTYKGEDGTILQGIGGAVFHFYGANGATVTGLTFRACRIFLDGPTNTNIVIDNNVFLMQGLTGSYNDAIAFTTGLKNSRITNNLFTGYSRFGIFGYGYKGLTISNNEFINVTAAMHIDAQGTNNQANGDLLVSQNYVTGAKGMGFEFQGASSNDQFLDNWFEHPNLQAGSSRNAANDNSFGFSLILDRSANIYIARNTVIAPERPDTVGCRVGFELGGDNAVCEDNYINGISITAADNDGVGTGSVIFRNNKVANYQYGDYQAFPAPNRTYQSYNNGPGVGLSWDINRPHPTRNGSIAAPAPTPPAPDPTPAPVNTGDAPSNLVAKAVGADSISLTWKDNYDQEWGFRLERSTDQQSWSQIASLAPNVESFVNTGLPTNTTFWYRIRWFDGERFSDYSNVASVTTGSGN